MPRLRGPVLRQPTGDDAWPMLNEVLFGGNDVGGPNVAPRPAALPVAWPQVFGRTAPLTLEIGFNRGRFLQALAEAWPDLDHVGVEIRRRYVWRFANLVGPAGAPRNVRVVWADAKLVAPVIFGPGALSHIFINFPDPWWKRRHAKRRLVDTDLAGDLNALLAPGGRVWVKSDVPAIAGEIEQALAAVPGLSGPEPFGAEDLPASYRETRCVAQGLPITRFHFTRTGG